MKKFYYIVDGEKLNYKFKSGEFAEYREICFAIWGCMPLEVSWAIETKIYKNYKHGQIKSH